MELWFSHQEDISISGMPKIAQNLSVSLKGDSLIKVQISLKHGQESASFKSADFAQGIFSAKNINQTKALDKKQTSEKAFNNLFNLELIINFT